MTGGEPRHREKETSGPMRDGADVHAASVLVTQVRGSDDDEKARVSHLVVLAHGIDGTVRDMHAIREAIETSGAPGVTAWETKANEGSRTHAGVFGCAERVWNALLPELEKLKPTAALPLHVSFIGHSMGALVLRAVAAMLHASSRFADSSVVLDTLMCIGAPHLGCRLLGRGGGGGVAPLMSAFGPSIMRAGLRLIKGRTGPDLLLDNDTLHRLTDDAHCEAMRAFRRRLVYCNGSGDWLVNAESASLLSAAEMRTVIPLSELSCRQPNAGVLWRPGASEVSTMGAHLRFDLHTSALVLLPLPEDWESTRDADDTALKHSTWDDGVVGRHTGKRARACAGLLRRLRSCGEWELHLAHFRGCSSFAGGVFSPHIDLVALPGKVTQPHGHQVVKHLVANLLRQHSDPHV